MARHNEVRLLGYLIREPILRFTDLEKTNLVRATIQIRTLRGSREFGDDKRKGYDEHIIMSQQESQMNFMRYLHANDIIEVKGNLITIATKPKVECPKCQHQNSYEDTMAVVNPIFMSFVETKEEFKRIDPDNEMSIIEKNERYLRKRIEISNNIAVIGDCLRPPEMFEEKNIVNYGLDIIRKYRIRSDDTTKRHDYPNVKCYGVIAKNDYKYIHKGSRVFIDGFVMSRSYDKSMICEECGHEFMTRRSRNEIVPYSVEYLSNCNPGFENVNNEVNEGGTVDDDQ